MVAFVAVKLKKETTNMINICYCKIEKNNKHDNICCCKTEKKQT